MTDATFILDLILGLALVTVVVGGALVLAGREAGEAREPATRHTHRVRGSGRDGNQIRGRKRGWASVCSDARRGARELARARAVATGTRPDPRLGTRDEPERDLSRRTSP
ncbi:hypothetical protein [Knoellia koreensis]|uniref:Uncharacterized protein n=1 Tax=Knoellia koreensis TaxID=2730921 RepID=A0A849HE56_9MICO|nr:hypothetical protein [Knoellia sp. DB2414S]NNM48210.1 hypothetical protein [Knoellia sp. DB2414S]